MIPPSHQLKAAPPEIIAHYYGELFVATFKEVEKAFYLKANEFVSAYKESERRLYELLKGR
jgi:hypothetical protein